MNNYINISGNGGKLNGIEGDLNYAQISRKQDNRVAF